MVVRCEKCNCIYDDVNRWTICPHGPLGFAHDDYCRKCDTLKLVHGPCPHQQTKEQECTPPSRTS